MTLNRAGDESVNNRESFFHLHLISDATGETLITVARAAAAQYAHTRAIEHMHAMVRTAKQIDRIVTELEERPGIVLYTLVDRTLGERLEAECRRIGIPCASVLEPILQLLQSYLGTAGDRRIGAQHVLDAEYFRRIDALNFTMMHDDGQLAGALDEADVVLVGISRTSKTPTSIYLANRGIKTANVPIVPGIPLPVELETITRPLVVGLVASPARIIQLRANRILGLNAAQKSHRATLDAMHAAVENRDLNTRAYQNELVETEKVIRAQLVEALMSAQHYKTCYDHVALQSQLNLVVGTEVWKRLGTAP